MTDQQPGPEPGDVLGEAGRLFENLRRRMSGGDDEPAGDVWSQVIDDDARDRAHDAAGQAHDAGQAQDAAGQAGEGGDQAGDPGDQAGDRARRGEDAGHRYIATGAAECLYCPVCRTISAARASGHDVSGHLREAGRSLLAAAREALAGFAAYGRPGRPGRSGSGTSSEPPRRTHPGEDPMDIG